MKLLIVTAEPARAPVNGVGKFVWDFYKNSKKYFDVKLCCMQIEPFITPSIDITEDEEYKADYVITAESAFNTESIESKYMFAAHKALPFAKQIIRDFQPDIIYLQSLKVWLPFRYEENVVMAFHGLAQDIFRNNQSVPLLELEKKLEIEAIQKSIGIVVFSQFMKNRIKEIYTSDKNIFVLPLFFNANLYKENKSNKECTISYIGRIDDTQKGYSLFLESTANLPDKDDLGRIVKYHVWGKEGEIIHKKDFPLVFFHGYVTGTDLIDAFAQSDIVVMPSKYEPFGYVGLEAMASGCLLLATVGQGTDEYCISNKNMIAIEPTISDVKTCLEKSIDTFSKHKLIIRNGKQTAQKWIPKECIKKHNVLFSRLLEK